MQNVYKLVGYRSGSRGVASEYEIPRDCVKMAMELAEIDPYDLPHADYELSASQAREIGKLVRQPINPDLEYFFETFATKRAHA